MTTGGTSRSPEQQEVLRVAIEYFLRDVHVALPGQIEKYDATTQKADVKPLVKRLLATDDGEELEEALPVIPGVPVVFPRGGGFFISMPVKKGDHCLLVFNSFPIDKFKAGTGKDTNPEDFAMHELSDAVAIMGFAPFKRAIEGADPDNVVIGKEGGTQIHLAADKIELGQKGATEQAVINSKLQSTLADLATQFTQLVSDFNSHTSLDTYIAPLIPAAAAPVIPVPPTVPSTASYSPTATESSLVTIKE